MVLNKPHKFQAKWTNSFLCSDTLKFQTYKIYRRGKPEALCDTVKVCAL